MHTRCQRNTIINDSHAVEPAQSIAQLIVRVTIIITEVWLGASACANGLANSLADARDTRGRRMTSIARHKLDAASMGRVLILWARQHFGLDGAETVQDDSCGRPLGRILGNALDRELNKLRRTARVCTPAHLFSINSKRRRRAGKVRIIREMASCDFGKNDAEGENVGREIKLVAEEDLGRHVCICTAKGETTGLFLVAGGNAGESKI